MPHSHPPAAVRGAGGAGRRVRPSLSPGERAVGRAGTARARVPAWGATSVRKHKALRGGPPACRPPPHRRATPDLPPQQRRSHRRHRPPGRPRPRPGPPPAHAPCRAPSSGRTDRTDGRRHAADGGLVFVGRFTPEPHSTPLSSPHFTAEETGAPRSAHSCLKAQPAPVPILWSGPLCSPASSGVSRPRSHPCFGERCWAAGSALRRFCIISTRRDPAPQHLLGAQHAALRTLSLWPTLPSMTGI